MEKRRLEAIYDLHNKNEGFDHAVLKSEMCELMREKGKTWEKKSVKTEVQVKGIGKVDIVATFGDATIAIECGTTNAEKIAALKEKFDIVLHVPYCYTGDLYGLKKDELSRQIMVVNIGKGLEAKGLGPVVRGKILCLAKGECSLPSGRDGYPEEAIQIASGHTKERQTQ